jgi:hypothetical protein
VNWYCASCGHYHAAKLANICVGCPCPEVKPPSASTWSPTPDELDRALLATDRADGEPALDSFGRYLGVYVLIGDRWHIQARNGGGSLYPPLVVDSGAGD